MTHNKSKAEDEKCTMCKRKITNDVVWEWNSDNDVICTPCFNKLLEPGLNDIFRDLRVEDDA